MKLHAETALIDAATGQIDPRDRASPHGNASVVTVSAAKVIGQQLPPGRRSRTLTRVTAPPSVYACKRNGARLTCPASFDCLEPPSSTAVSSTSTWTRTTPITPRPITPVHTTRCRNAARLGTAGADFRPKPWSFRPPTSSASTSAVTLCNGRAWPRGLSTRCSATTPPT